MTDKKIIIIGAGIAGLSAGCFAQMKGFQSQIFEMHYLPGGQCTSWRRKGFVFDGCIHHLAGCRPVSPLYSMWEELGALPTRPIIFPEHICCVESEAGKTFHVYADIDRLKQHMLELFPQDAHTIHEYIKGARTFTEFDMLDTPLLRGTSFSRRFLKLLTLMKWSITMKKYAEKFKDPFLRKAFPTIQYDSPDTPMLAHLNILGNSHIQNYGVPVGGSLEFSRAIEKKYLKFGGKISYNSRVERVLVANNHAVGVRLADGSEHRSNIVISDVFAPTAIFGMLGGQYVSESIRRQFSKPIGDQGMGVQVSFGLARDLSKEPRALIFFLEKPVKIADWRSKCSDMIPVLRLLVSRF
jgi:phytoene dehydrogenase-like protein